MPDSLSFLTIPANLYDPGSYIEFDNSMADGPLPAQPRKLLFFGQSLAATAIVQPGILTRMRGANDGKKYFGRGSMLAAMVEAKFTADPSTELWCIALADNPAGTAAVWHALFAGTATAAGTFSLYIGGPGLAGLTSGAQVQFAVTVGMTAAQAATALTAAIAALLDLPVTAAVDGVTPAQVDITMKWKGASGNDLDIRQHYHQGDQPPAGLTLTVTVGTAGAANPVLTPAIAAMGTKWFTDIGMPYTDATSLAAIATEMERRWGSTVQQDGIIYSFSPLSLGAIEAIGAGLNEKLQCLVGMPFCPTPSWVCAAVIATTAAYYLAIDPAAPLDSSLTLTGIAPPAASDQLQHTDREAMMHDGIATLIVTASETVAFNRMITTYQTNASGLPDQSYLDAETLATLSYLRFWVRARIASSWPRYKLSDDPTDGGSLPRGTRVTCPKLIGLDLVAGTDDLYGAGIVDDPDAFAASLQVVRSTTNEDEVDSILPWTTIKRFRVFAGQIQFR